ncbi:hypothetical protein SAMN04489717_1245 [Actinopolymorpha singaporensis]|uniref:Protein RecA n=1 Tax=Actinopolymorpha singaporensis TaxID=117157 RepID=A0A1H1NI16_9ACTN|nr:hypothetical protein SAMN04489717_1245 [Actinopolymorpha singaporensis]
MRHRSVSSEAGPRRSAADRAAVLAELRAEIAARPTTAGVAGRAVPTVPALPAFAGLLPDGGLRRGASYTVAGSTTLTLALVAGASKAGSWCGLVGFSHLGAEAATGLGVDLGRLVLVPTPGRKWPAVVAALVDVLDVVVVRPPTSAPDGEVRQLAARVRERGAVLVVQDADWSGSELGLSIISSTWHGLGAGHGHLSAREVTIQATGRGTAGRRRTSRLWLPDHAGAVAVATEPATATADQPTVRPVDQPADRSDEQPGEVISLAGRRLSA